MRRILPLTLLIALPGALLGQEGQMERLREAFPAAAVSQIETILAAAEAADVPTQPLLAKALEGAAKRVPAERVIAALSDYSTRLQEATVLVGPERESHEVVAAADALRRGVPEQTVRSLAGSHSGQLSVPLVVLGDLIETGVPAEGAIEVVQSALADEKGPDELLAIPGAVRRMVREGSSPADAANAVGKAMGHGKGLGGTAAPQSTPRKGPPGGPPVPPGAGPPTDKKPKKEKPPPDGVFDL